MWSADKYIEMLYEEKARKHTDEYNDKWKVNLKRKFQELLGDFQADKEALNPVILEEIDMGSYQRLRVEITTISTLKMPVYLLIPKTASKEKLPAVIAIHGHGYGSKEIVGLKPDGSNNLEAGYHENFAVALVKQGMVVVAPELVGFGDRKLEADRDAKSPTDNSCFRIASQLLLVGKTLAGLRVEECRRLIDFTQSLKQVDETKIGCMGISGGGLVAAFTTILDERIKAVVISGYTNTFKGSIMDRRHCLDNYIPRILEYAEMPELIGLIAPRSLFIEAGIHDHLFPYEHVSAALEKLQEIYKVHDAEKQLANDFFEGGHEISGEKSYDWLKGMLIND